MRWSTAWTSPAAPVEALAPMVLQGIWVVACVGVVPQTENLVLANQANQSQKHNHLARECALFEMVGGWCAKSSSNRLERENKNNCLARNCFASVCSLLLFLGSALVCGWFVRNKQTLGVLWGLWVVLVVWREADALVSFVGASWRVLSQDTHTHEQRVGRDAVTPLLYRDTLQCSGKRLCATCPGCQGAYSTSCCKADGFGGE